MPKRTYSREDKASVLAVLDSHEGFTKPTAEETGVPHTTVRGWRDGKGVDEETQAIRTVKKEELSDIFERVARKYLAQAETDNVITATRGKDAVISAATATDKMQLLRGKATSIAGTSIVDSAKEFLSALKERMPELSELDLFELSIKSKSQWKDLTPEMLGIEEVRENEEDRTRQ